ncbi:unnamed protein product [Miscanthus lutarioriparius]|uniref:FAS1 domain-containing protein n=1 Tax=Miscanthus lutarioriparius TaxID=422564 RepID=A0A811PYV3_9POAL|nr:unnamed protein product [Miscanthus lutarioriparius]
MAPFLLVLLAVPLPAPPSLGAGYGEGAGTIGITKILAGFPEFSNFSAMLTETNVALGINSRDKVTVLAPNNTAVAAAFCALPKIPRSFLADLLALHVVLDYIDEPRLGAWAKAPWSPRCCRACAPFRGAPASSASTPGATGAPRSPPPLPRGSGTPPSRGWSPRSRTAWPCCR